MSDPLSNIPITVVIPIKNEAMNLPGCLGKLGTFEEVLVLDSGSTDESVQIAEEFGARVLQFQWNGRFPKKRNWCLRTYSFKTDWVLFLDADEQVTPEFMQELSTITHDPKYASYNGFWVTYHNYFMGRLLKHGDTLHKLPLLRLGHGEYERIDEDAWSALDMEVHEHLVVAGPVGHMKAPIIHNDFKGLSAYYDRHNHYSSWEAARYLSLRDADRSQGTWEQKIKYRLLESKLFPILYFLGAYILKGGFLDGRAGFCFSVSKMFYFYQVNFKIAEKRAEARIAAKAKNSNEHGT